MIIGLFVLAMVVAFVYVYPKDGVAEALWWSFMAALGMVFVAFALILFFGNMPFAKYTVSTPAEMVTENATQVVLKHGDELTTVDRDEMKYDDKCEGSDYREDMYYLRSWVLGVKSTWKEVYVSCANATPVD